MSLINGCATLPRVSEKIDAAPAAGSLVKSYRPKDCYRRKKVKLSWNDSNNRLIRRTYLERYTAVIESVTESPLTKGNKVTLLIDGPATYAAMFEAIRGAKDNINLETFILEDDEIGKKFTDLLLQKQAQGVQVNIIYDSMGSFTTSESFFQRLRDRGIHVVEFNPISPLKGHLKWLMINPDHRKILIVDGKVAISGGINISNVYSGKFSGRKKVKGEPLPWRDTDIKIEGPAVAEFQKLFMDTWSKQEGPKLSGPKLLPEDERRRE